MLTSIFHAIDPIILERGSVDPQSLVVRPLGHCVAIARLSESVRAAAEDAGEEGAPEQAGPGDAGKVDPKRVQFVREMRCVL